MFISRRLYRIEYRDNTAHFLTRSKPEDEALILGSFPIAALQTIMKWGGCKSGPLFQMFCAFHLVCVYSLPANWQCNIISLTNSKKKEFNHLVACWDSLITHFWLFPQSVISRDQDSALNVLHLQQPHLHCYRQVFRNLLKKKKSMATWSLNFINMGIYFKGHVEFRWLIRKRWRLMP